MAAFTISYTDTTIKFSVTGLTSGQEVRFYVRYEPAPSDGSAVVDESYTTSSSTLTKTFSGLTPNTEYACNVGIVVSGVAIFGTTQYFTTNEAEVSLDPWSWTSSNGSASTTLMKAAYTAVTTKGALSDFSYLVWNDMVDKVKAVLDATGLSWSSNYATYSATKMSSSDKELTAKRFNSLRFNIGSHYSTGISDVSSGDVVYGSYFITLASSLNSWIGQI